MLVHLAIWYSEMMLLFTGQAMMGHLKTYRFVDSWEIILLV
jgi:hypothetical protein